MDVLATAEQLKNELDALRPLNAEAEARIMQKFRLDWNYHSNNLEGNSLTYGETKALILFGITAQGKPLKDHFEITGHNEALNWIIEIVKEETVLTEAFIRQLHTLLLKESSYKEAQTPNGKPTRRKIEVGKYKTQPNHVITQTGETFYFAAPEETPAKMQELIEWFRKEKENPDTNPIILAALFHYKFIRIHPFDDGNGRVARILMNFILMQFGFPPAIIKTEDKENYYAVLRLADADELAPFIEYIAQNLIRSLELMIKGARGESIEEPEDLDKELALLKQRVKGVGKRIEVSKTKDVLLDVFENSIEPLINRFIEICQKFDDFYIKTEFLLFYGGGATHVPKDVAVTNAKLKILDKGDVYDAALHYYFINFRQTGFEDFDFSSRIDIKFDLTNYRVSIGEEFKTYEKLYSERLSQEEIEEIVKTTARLHKEFIEGKIEDKTKAQRDFEGFMNWFEKPKD